MVAFIAIDTLVDLGEMNENNGGFCYEDLAELSLTRVVCITYEQLKSFSESSPTT